ncbi:MAG TPA: Ig-like domain-containing protein, partial [Flavobacterium sp.]|uniref:beta strand repeat-containing protein n=1 Tax=Flavobacterium sp. TaxID=239 RepID=UPI002ED5DE31
MKKILLILLVGLFQNFIFGATITSTGTGGNWTSGSSWVGGIVPAVTDDVVIASGSTITVDANVSARSITVSGTMAIPADANVSINSLLVVVTSPSGRIYFNKKAVITFPQNVSLYLQNGSNSLDTDGNGVCSNNTEIHVGTTNYAVCTGGGATYTFDQVESAGGINTAVVLSGNQYICTYGTTTTTFTSTVSSGTWSSNNNLIATVNSSTGVVTAISPGTATITYTVAGGGSATRAVYVANGPSANAVVSGSTTQCQNTTTSYTASAVSGASSYTWSYDGSGATITPAANGLSASISFSSTATSGNLKVTTTNSCGSAGGGNELWITINPIIAAAPVATSISGNVQCSYAEPQWNTVANAIGYYLDIATDSGFTNFVAGYNNYFVSGNNGSSPASPLPAGVLYYRVRGYNSCTTTANSNTVSFQTTAPVGGSVSPAQTICAGTAPTSNLTLSGHTTTSGTVITNWQSASDAAFTTNVNYISETTNVLTSAKIGVLNTSTYFRAVVQSQFGSWCMTNSTPVLITVNNSISAASATPTVCINMALTPITHTVIGFTGIGTVTGLPSGVTPSLSGNTLTISGTPTASGTFTYTIPLTGGTCGGTRNATGTITVTAAPATPGTITQPTNKCAGSTGNTYSIAAVSGATSYTWSVTGTGWAVTAGGTTTSATITIGSGAGTVSVTATNACGTSSASTTGSVTPTTAPATPGTITQPTNTCAGSTGNTYSIAAVSGATSYTWSVTGTGWSITAGGTTTSATITIGSGAGTVSVTATNACGTSSASTTGSVTPTTAPATPGTITQPTNKCAGSTGNTYSIAAVSGATSYTWSVTGTGWSVTAGGTTTSATITVGSGIGTVSVTATNTCGTSSASTTGGITPDPNLPASVSIVASPSGAICSGTSVTFTATPVNPGIAPTYQWRVNGSNVGTNSSVSTFTTTTLANNDVVSVVMTSNASPCLTGSPATSAGLTITVNPRPTPTFITLAQAQTCGDQHMTYETQAGQSNYVWTVSGTLNTDYTLIARGTTSDNDIVIEWLTAGTKTVTVNYNNSFGCNGTTAAIYTTDVIVIDRGRVNGGTHICKGNPLPTLTLQNYAGNVIYPDSSLVLIWQYSDDFNNATWHDIAGTAGQTSYTPAVFPGAFRTYQVILKNGNCTKTSIETRINIDAFNAPALSSAIYPTCSVSTGSVVLNNLPSGNWTINQMGTVTATYTNIIPNTTSYTVTGLATGSYTFTVSEGSCTSDASLILNMSQAANTWDGTKWSKTGDTTLPVADDRIVFEGNYTLSTDLTGCSCTVNSGNVIVNSGITLTITNAVIVNGGTLTFENNASLIQTTNAVNSGAIIYKRISYPMKNFDATYWSSPVAGQTLVNLSPNTLADKYIAYYDSAWKTEARTNVMKPGIGYAIRVPKPNYWPIPTATTYAQPVEFKGVPNNGNITSSQAITAGKYYLIGNP